MKNSFLMKMFVVAILMIVTMQSFAQMEVSDFTTFDEALTTLKATEGGGAITLSATITIAQDYTIAFDEAHPITITMGGNSIKIDGVTNDSQTANTLTIGDNVTFVSTGGSLSNANKGKLNITGGVMTTTGGTPINVTAGNATISGGTFTSGSNRLVQVNNSYSATITGGTFTVTSANAAGRCVYAAGGNTVVNITGGTFVANNTGNNTGVAILADDNSTACVVTVSGATFSGTGVAFRAQKSARIIVREADTEAIATIATKDANAKIYDFRNILIEANPASGIYAGTQLIELTSDAATSLSEEIEPGVANSAYGATTIRYTTDETAPLAASTEYSVPVSVAIPSVLKAVVEKDGYISSLASFVYEQLTSIDKPLAQQGIVYSGNVISFSEAVKDARIYDVAGQLAQSVKDTNSLVVNDLQRGIYVLKYNGESGSGIFKFIKK
ncbi:MAG: T9SS type A sorting domain-containing protein [Candidatus Symbiothrix sp.]|jgi:hypothetical protein|nr:T9SS type A sorting domain-containing protein [Candidatus Symbiothrix sp.]